MSSVDVTSMLIFKDCKRFKNIVKNRQVAFNLSYVQHCCHPQCMTCHAFYHTSIMRCALTSDPIYHGQRSHAPNVPSQLWYIQSCPSPRESPRACSRYRHSPNPPSSEHAWGGLTCISRPSLHYKISRNRSHLSCACPILSARPFFHE